MDRELVLLVLTLLVCGPILLLFGAWPASPTGDGAARKLERRAWSALWLPTLPAVLALATLLGWALQEPEHADETLRPMAWVLAAAIGLTWLRTVSRAFRALRTPRFVPIGTVGLVRPRIVASPDFVAAVDRPALRAAFAHEAAHVRHRDPLRLWLGQLAADLQWPLPSARARLAQWRLSLELARDDEARSAGVDGADLAAAILAAAQFPRASRALSITAALGDPGSVIALRVARLLAPSEDADAGSPTWPARLALGTAVLMAVIIGVRYGDGIVRTLPGVSW